MQCTWLAASGPWWVSAWVYPLAAYDTWSEDPATVERTAAQVASRSLEWTPPSGRAPESESLPDCERLLADVSDAAPDARLAQSGGEIDPIDFFVIEASLAAGCYWEIPTGVVLPRIQPGLGEYAVADLRAAGAEDYELPNGSAAWVTTLSPYWATLMTSAGGTRFSVSGSAVASDPAAAARVLETIAVVSMR